MKLKILVIGRHDLILETVLRLINGQPEWTGIGALTDEEAVKQFEENPIDLVLIGGGVDQASELNLSEKFRKIKPGIKIVKHYGGGSGLLFNEIMLATSNQ